MATGWAKDGAVQDQIEASIEDEINRMKALRKTPKGESFEFCAECGEAIPQARREAIVGVKICIDCQKERDARFTPRGGINRRAPKGSQLK